MPRARPFAGVIGGLTGQKRPVPLDNTETTQIPKLQKIDTSEIEKVRLHSPISIIIFSDSIQSASRISKPKPRQN
jgi:hypothetical protein